MALQTKSSLSPCFSFLGFSLHFITYWSPFFNFYDQGIGFFWSCYSKCNICFLDFRRGCKIKERVFKKKKKKQGGKFAFLWVTFPSLIISIVYFCLLFGVLKLFSLSLFFLLYFVLNIIRTRCTILGLCHHTGRGIFQFFLLLMCMCLSYA